MSGGRGRIEGKVAIVTGAGSSPGPGVGVGKAISVVLAREGGCGDSHGHNDYLSGLAELTARQPITVLGSAEARLGYHHRPVADGEMIEELRQAGKDGLRCIVDANSSGRARTDKQ